MLDTSASYPRVSASVTVFKQGALTNTSQRIRARVSPTVEIKTLTPTDAIADIRALPRDIAVLMYQILTGQSQTAFAPVRTELKLSGHKLIELRCQWDAMFWPHATAGFFKVKDKITALLHTLGMSEHTDTARISE